MLKNQRGNVIFWVIAVVLAIALFLILALPGKYNLDPEQNTNDCTTFQKNIWVAVDHYVTDTKKDFSGDLELLRKTHVPNSSAYYLTEEKYCPESQSKKDPYQVLGKYVTEVVDGETRGYSAVIIICPNLSKFGNHILDKNFFDNQSTSKLQNVMVTDMGKINLFTKSNSKLKAEYVQKYFDYWKNSKFTEFNAAITDPAYLAMRTEVTGEIPVEPTEEVTATN